jgi:energy-converting hydrogenase Eha subunit A
MPIATATHARLGALDQLGRWSPPIGAFLAGGGPVVLLGFNNGGYEVVTVAGYGVALWWLVLVGFLTGAIPRPSPTPGGRVVLGSLLALAAWGSVSLGWSADAERGLTEVARIVVAGGSLLLGMSAVRAGHARVLAGGVLAGLTAIVAAAALSRLQPGLFPAASTTAELLATDERTSWPLNYWNAIGAAGAMALPLAIALATRARHAWTAALAIAPVPVLALGVAFTLSRGGIVAAICGVLVLLLTVAPRLVLARTLLGPAVAVAAVIGSAWQHPALIDASGGAAQADAGDRVIAVVVLSTAGVALLQAGWTTADRAWWTPRLPRPRRSGVIAAAAGVAVITLAVVALAVGAPERATEAWDDFRVPTVSQTVANDSGSDRLGSISGNGRYQVWSGAWDAATTHPLGGIGLGSWESWWNPRRGDTGFLRNAHSQPFEVAAELGLAGAFLFVAIIGIPALSGMASGLRSRALASDAAIAAPALVAFTVSISIDWNWQISAFAVAGMTLAAVAVARPVDDTDSHPPADRHRGRRRAAVRHVAIGLVSVASIIVLSTALVPPQAVDLSRAAAARGDLQEAAALATDGAAAANFAASPLLQLAAVREKEGRLAAAASAAQAATRRTPEDWRPWFVLARVETARGRDQQALMAFRRARQLNPNSKVLAP